MRGKPANHRSIVLNVGSAYAAPNNGRSQAKETVVRNKNGSSLDVIIGNDK